MIKGELENGTKMYVVRIEHFVKISDFVKHLAEHYYCRNITFDCKLTKKEAEEILRRGLFFEGLHGSLSDHYFDAAFEEGERWNAIYNHAHEWVKHHYPWLCQ